MHDYEHVKMDVETSLNFGTDEVILIFDDYGLAKDIRQVVGEYIKSGILEEIQFVGEDQGSDCRRGRKLEAPEGIMCRRVK